MKHKKTRLFKHFMTILNILALATPFAVLGFHALNDSLPKYFASQSVQHHGGESDVFSDDLDYANQELKTRSLDDNLFLTMESMNYINEGVSSSFVSKVAYETNDIETTDDFVSGRVYRLYMLDNRGLNLDDVTGENFYMVCPLLAYYFSLNETFTTEFDETTLQSSMSLNDVSMSLVYNGTWSFTIIFGDYINSNYVASLCEVDGDYDTLDECYFDFIYLEDTDYEYFFNYVGLSLPLFFKSCPVTYFHYVESESSTISSIDDWKEYYNNKTYVQIIDTGVNSHLPLNVDFVSLFAQSDIVNHNGNIATILFINFYCNWILNISLIIFLPQVLLCFINWCIDLVYKLTETKEV